VGREKPVKNKETGRGPVVSSAYPAQVGPCIHCHQRVPDPSDHAGQAWQALGNPPVGDKEAVLHPWENCCSVLTMEIKLNFLNFREKKTQVSGTWQGQSFRVRQ
jgi:hypothetical protein